MHEYWVKKYFFFHNYRKTQLRCETHRNKPSGQGQRNLTLVIANGISDYHRAETMHFIRLIKASYHLDFKIKNNVYFLYLTTSL